MKFSNNEIPLVSKPWFLLICKDSKNPSAERLFD